MGPFGEGLECGGRGSAGRGSAHVPAPHASMTFSSTFVSTSSADGRVVTREEHVHHRAVGDVRECPCEPPDPRHRGHRAGFRDAARTAGLSHRLREHRYPASHGRPSKNRRKVSRRNQHAPRRRHHRLTRSRDGSGREETVDTVENMRDGSSLGSLRQPMLTPASPPRVGAEEVPDFDRRWLAGLERRAHHLDDASRGPRIESGPGSSHDRVSSAISPSAAPQRHAHHRAPALAPPPPAPQQEHHRHYRPLAAPTRPEPVESRWTHQSEVASARRFARAPQPTAAHSPWPRAAAPPQRQRPTHAPARDW